MHDKVNRHLIYAVYLAVKNIDFNHLTIVLRLYAANLKLNTCSYK